MRFILPLVVIVFLVATTECYSQQARHTTLKRSAKNRSLRAPSISKARSRVICPIFTHSEYPYQAIGIKLGDPVAITYKYYPNKHFSFALDVGKAASGLYSKYYRKAFVNYLPDSLSGEETVKYLSHRAITDWYGEAKFLYQWNAESISKGLQFYTGVGLQWRQTKLEYDYLYEDGLFESHLGKFERSRFTYGPSAIIGFEYSYFSLPLSAFIEVEWFADALLDQGYNRFQGGVGLRYVF